MDLLEGEPRAWKKRGIWQETAEKFGMIRTEFRGRPAYAFPHYSDRGQLVAQKVRMPGKRFTIAGDASQMGLFGKHAWKPGGKYLVITEGELDAMSYSQTTNNRFPAVSVPNGAQGAARAVQKDLEWVESFDTVVLMFDMDDEGQLAVKQVAEVISAGKVRIAQLPAKDANELIMDGREEDLTRAFWDARPYRPDGIVNAAELWNVVQQPRKEADANYPWECLQEYTRGLRGGELVVWTAGSGVGKSTACREIAYHLLQQGETVGIVALEESTQLTLLYQMGIHMGRQLHLGRPDDITDEQWEAAFRATAGTGRLHLYDHWGSLESERLISKLRYLIRGCGCRWIILDHISIVISGLETANERRDLDIVMTKLRSLAEETGAGIMIVSHIKRLQGKSANRGAEIELSDLRGSAALEQLADIVIALERDQQDPEWRSICRVRVLKNRPVGWQLGVAGYLRYDAERGRLQDAEDDVFTNDAEEETFDG